MPASTAAVSTKGKGSLAQVREQLQLQRELDTLAADVRCLTEALDDRPAPPPRGPPLEAAPLEMGASDSRPPWPHTAGKTAAGQARLTPGLGYDEVLRLEERTSRLLSSLEAAPADWSGPLTEQMIAAAKPPPHKPRTDAVRVCSGGATTTAASYAPPSVAIDDTDLQPQVGSRMDDARFAQMHRAAAPPVVAAPAARVVASTHGAAIPNYDDLQRDQWARAAASSSLCSSARSSGSFSQELLKRSAGQGSWAAGGSPNAGVVASHPPQPTHQPPPEPPKQQTDYTASWKRQDQQRLAGAHVAPRVHNLVKQPTGRY